MKQWIIKHTTKQVLVRANAPTSDMKLASQSAKNHGYTLVVVF